MKMIVKIISYAIFIYCDCVICQSGVKRELCQFPHTAWYHEMAER